VSADTGLDVVTGAVSYTGRSITELLLAQGRSVRTLTHHTDRAHGLGADLDVRPYRFDDGRALAATLEGVSTLYNTYWVRFTHGGASFEAVANSRLLFEAAADAGVRRIVHISITNPSADSELPYFRGKALVERALVATGASHAIVRPTVVFGRGDVLLNNIAWLLRRLPLFAVPGSGRYRVRPVHVDDVARLCVAAGAEADDMVIDAVGPEVLTFEDMVDVVRRAVGSRARLVHVPLAAVPVLTRLLGLLLRDVLLTTDELRGLMAELVTTDGPATGEIAFSEWLAAEGDHLGRKYASELARHFRVPATA